MCFVAADSGSRGAASLPGGQTLPNTLTTVLRGSLLTTGMKSHSLMSLAAQFHASCIPPSAATARNVPASANALLFARPVSVSPPPPPSFIHAAAFAQSWESFLHGPLRNKTPQSHLPTGDIKGGNIMQVANIFIASELLPQGASLHWDIFQPWMEQDSCPNGFLIYLWVQGPCGSAPSQGSECSSHMPAGKRASALNIIYFL